MHRSISNEAFLNFPRIPTDRNYPFLEQNPPPLSLSLILILRIELSIFISVFSPPSSLSFFFVPHFIPFHRFSNGDEDDVDGIFQRLESKELRKKNRHKLRINGVLGFSPRGGNDTLDFNDRRRFLRRRPLEKCDDGSRGMRQQITFRSTLVPSRGEEGREKVCV